MRNVEKILSRDNAQIKHLSKLIKSKKERMQSREFVTEGIKLSLEAAENSVKIICTYFTKEALGKYSEKLEKLMELSEKCVEISEDINKKISDAQTPQGVYCLCAMLDKERSTVKIDTDGHYMVLCGLQDPGNVGTILRTCEAMGIEGVILTSDCPDIYSPKVLRSTMGGVFRVPVEITDNIEKTINSAREKHVPVYAAALDRTAVSIRDADLKSGSMVLVGNEGNGLSDEVRAMCDRSLFIDMKGNAESLNAAVAASIIAWEMS